MDTLLAKWAHTLMVRSLRENGGLTVFAADGVGLDFFFAERTLAGG